MNAALARWGRGRVPADTDSHVRCGVAVGGCTALPERKIEHLFGQAGEDAQRIVGAVVRGAPGVRGVGPGAGAVAGLQHDRNAVVGVPDAPLAGLAEYAVTGDLSVRGIDK